MANLTLGEQDARIVALAITYHLGRPGSETDPDTLLRHDLGLGPVQATLAPQLGRAQATFELTPYQLHRLDESLLGLTNELKQYELAQRRSAVPGFEAAVARLFPVLAPASDGEQDDSALDLVTHVVLLRRRLAAAVADAKATLAAERLAAEEAARGAAAAVAGLAAPLDLAAGAAKVTAYLHALRFVYLLPSARRRA